MESSEKIFYLLIENEKKGPFTLSELKEFDLTLETQIWYYKINDWKNISEIQELKDELKYHLKPPNYNNDNPTKAKPIVPKEQLKTEITTENTTKKIFSKSEIQFMIFWLAFHSFALLTSYGEVTYFNTRGWQSTKVIWPFHSSWTWCRSGNANLIVIDPRIGCEGYGGVTTFNGFFSGYSIVDFLLYIGIAIVIATFIYINRISLKKQD
jgi:hypothetical protein